MKIIQQVKHKVRCFFDSDYKRYWQEWVDLFTPHHKLETEKKPEQNPDSPIFDDGLKAYEYTINDATTDFKDLKLVHFFDLCRWPQDPKEIQLYVCQFVDGVIRGTPQHKKHLLYYRNCIVKDLCEWLYNAKIGDKR